MTSACKISNIFSHFKRHNGRLITGERLFQHFRLRRAQCQAVYLNTGIRKFEGKALLEE